MQAMTGISWVGPFTVEAMLRGCCDRDHPKPPESSSVYVVSLHPWAGCPTSSAGILYVGGNTGSGMRFRTRIGDLIADLFGFYTDTTGHHSGGYSLHRHCEANGLDPMTLRIGWAEHAPCGRCLEVEMVQALMPLLNKKRPPACRLPECGSR